MKGADEEIASLRARLQADVLALRGQTPGPAPRFGKQLLIPLAVLAAAGLVIALQPAASKRWFLALALRTTLAALQLARPCFTNCKLADH